MANTLKLGIGSKTVSANGTAEPLASQRTLVRTIIIQALSSNSNKVYVGDSTVDSNTAALNGVYLEAGNTISFEAPMMGQAGMDDLDLSEIYIDTDTDDEGVTFVFYKRN